MSNYRDLEAYCESQFIHGGPYWHIYTPGLETPVLFGVKEDYVFAMNLICQAAMASDGVGILAFEVMSNHLHMVGSGEKPNAEKLFAFLDKRLRRCAKTLTCKEIPSSFIAQYKEIDSLQSLRNTIVYVNRNGFVTDRKYTPFSYPWGTGKYYFNETDFIGVNADLTVNERRFMFRGRSAALPDIYRVHDGYITPSSYCNLKLGMSMFRDAHHYFFMVSKNVEAYGELALELDDGEYLTDTELISQMLKLVKRDYNLNSLRDMSKAQKYDFAKRLRFEFRSSNEQIRRVLNLTSAEVNTIFPLAAKK